jgi:hypothetical protein
MNFNFDILQQPYHRDHWKDLIRTLFPSESDLFATPTTFDLGSDRIESFVQFGNIELNDRYNSRLALFEVQLKPGTTKLQINRVALREIAEKMRNDTAITGAFAVFADAATGKWRFTFIAKAAVFGEKTVETADPKRYTYMLGKGETTRTAELRFKGLAGIANKRLEDILEAFSVEKINKEFFDQYKKQYETCWQYLAQPDSVAYQVFKINPKLADDKTRKPLRDFAKRLMGRLVFLYFLQKKGWMGCDANTTSYQDGDPDFTANLFRNLVPTEQAHFYSKQLTRLFFDTLNKPRDHDLFVMPDGSQVRVPYLNGGLFDGDVSGTEQFDFPAAWFTQLFEFFGQYNFTIDESSPNDHEIGIDPEMLGHIFENLLEENREKGAYYTPKEIVHYMCQESLLLYLKERLGLSAQSVDSHADTPLSIINSDSREADAHELEQFVRHKKRGKEAGFVNKNAPIIENLLKTVRICDPAIGSGAFPMGLLYEIFHCQVELDLTEHLAELKKEIIHHCIYGVDKDKGAVDIARLRFWLALVVDEDEPQPLPNLDYKIMQGDSLLERFEGIDLTNLLGENGNSNGNGTHTKTAPMLFETVQEPAVQFGDKDKVKLSRWLDRFFEPQRPEQKADLKDKIDRLINTELNEAIRRHKINLLLEAGEQKKSLQRELDLKRPGTKQQKEVARLEAEIVASEVKQERLAWWQERDEKPFFLWHTWFRDVFDRGGFDIVIGNPPYVQLQRLGHYSETLQLAGYDTFVRTGDLYCLFYEKALTMLLPGGVMAYITSNSWLKTLYGEPLRRYFVEKSTPVALLNFEDTQLFKAAIVETNILLAYKGEYQIETRALNIDEKADTDKALYEQVTQKGTVLQGLSNREWIIGDVASARLREKMKEGNILLVKLLELGRNKIKRGVTTGNNDVFILNKQEDIDIVSADSNSESIVFKMLRGRNLSQYSYTFANEKMLFTRRGIQIEDYPSALMYLSKHKDILEPRPKDSNDKNWIGRKPGSYKWYEIQDETAYFEDFFKPKIIWGELSDQPKFTYDSNGYFLNNTIFMMTGERLKFILAILNSKAAEWYFNQFSSTSGMGTNRWLRYKVEQIPIPNATPEQETQLEHLVDYMLWLKEKQQSGSSPHLQLLIDYTDQIINGLVYELYFPEALKQANMTLFEYLGNLPMLQEGEEESIIEVVFQRLVHKEHPMRNNLFYLQTIKEVKTIMEGLKSSKHSLETMLGTDYEETDHEN